MENNKQTPRKLVAKLATDIERKKIQYYEDTIHYIKTQLRTINTNKEKVKFLKDLLRNKVNGNEEFESYTRKSLLEKEPEIGIEIINSLFNSPDRTDKVNEYIKREIVYFSSIEDEKENEVIPEEIDFEKEDLEERTKIILLHELGVLKYLQTLEPFKENKTELSKFIAEIITGKEDKRSFKGKFNSMRTDLSYIDLPEKKIPKGKTPKTATAIRKVNEVLARYGLPVIAAK